ncbi:hypothetical protein T484DRAFT_1865819 [Baffinella frigidus]|nr:hypothetical protein T484DRAFT_1865819 [Cryptophyta sp. CCMP2293]
MRKSTPNAGEEPPDEKMGQRGLCPIFLEVMEDPVMTIDGHSYEHAAIEQW